MQMNRFFLSGCGGMAAVRVTAFFRSRGWYLTFRQIY